MSIRLEALAVEKEMLLMRSALCRLRLRRATHEVRTSLDWKRAVLGTARAWTVPPVVFGLALSIVGVGRAARWLQLAGRILVFARLARLVSGSVGDLLRRRAS